MRGKHISQREPWPTESPILQVQPLERKPETKQCSVTPAVTQSSFYRIETHPGNAHQQTIQYNSQYCSLRRCIPDPPGRQQIPGEKGEITPAKKFDFPFREVLYDKQGNKSKKNKECEWRYGPRCIKQDTCCQRENWKEEFLKKQHIVERYWVLGLPAGRQVFGKIIICNIANHQINPQSLIPNTHFYCASEILSCTPALVLTMGAEEEIYGFTLRWSKYNLMFTRLLST